MLKKQGVRKYLLKNPGVKISVNKTKVLKNQGVISNNPQNIWNFAAENPKRQITEDSNSWSSGKRKSHPLHFKSPSHQQQQNKKNGFFQKNNWMVTL